METVFEKRYDNYIVRKLSSVVKDVDIEDLSGQKKHIDEALIHFYQLSTPAGNFVVQWREDSLMYAALDSFISDESEVSQLAVEMILQNIFIVGSSADISHTFKTREGKETIDGLHLAVVGAISSYIERVSGYEPVEGDETTEAIIEEMRRAYAAKKTLDEITDKVAEKEK
jgi:hypothetical protein